MSSTKAKNASLTLLWLLVVALLVLDQITKWLALEYISPVEPISLTPFLNLVLVFNRGAAFGFLGEASGWQQYIFIAFAAAVSAMIAYMLWRQPRGNPFPALGLALVLPGAVGNLIDRIVYGKVVDFIDVFYGAWHWPAFNVADSAITIGAIVIILDSFGIGFGSKRSIAKENTHTPTP